MKNIFVGNLSFNASENAVRSLFEECGTVDRAEGVRAIESLSGRELNGRALTVNEARPKAERGSGGGSRDNHGGGFGGQRRNNRY
jgi:cold-inducible RNA-binding protein